MLRIICTFGLILIFSHLSGQTYQKMRTSGKYTVQEICQEAEKYFENRDKGRGSGYKQFKRWEYNAIRLQGEDGYLKPEYKNVQELERYNALLNENNTPRYTTVGDWEEMGPTLLDTTSTLSPGLGRITSFVVEKNNPNHIIAGSQTGGIWKTTDKGKKWIPLNDAYVNMNVYSLAMDPNNPNIYFWGSDQGRIYKSVNGGASWEPLESVVGTGTVIKIKFHPTNSDILFAAVYTDNIYRSSDGGKTWTPLPFYESGFDIEFKPDDPNVVYASGGGFYKSIDGGATFANVSGFASGPKMIGVSPANPDIVYVLEAEGSIFGGIYKSVDQGNTFTKLPHSKNYFGGSITGQDNFGQAPRDMDIAVSPTDANEVHIAGLITWKSNDGAATFHPTSYWVTAQAKSLGLGYCHADIDIMEFVGDNLFVGTDGGLFVAENTSKVYTRYFKNISSGMGIRQLYKFGVSQTPNVILSGGSQDNGTSYYRNGVWKNWLGNDGMETFIDKNDPDIIYGTTQNGDLYRKNKIGKDYNYIGKLEPGNWVTPMEQDPIAVNTFYMGYNHVYKFTEQGYRHEIISQNFGLPLNCLKVAPSDNRTMYASLKDQLYKTSNGGKTDWQRLDNFSGIINEIAIHPKNPDRVAIATNSYDKVYITENGGASWTSYRYNLPDFSALSLVWQVGEKNGLFLGMNYGVYFLEDGTTRWKDYRSNLPNVIINELEINYADGYLYAATYGRGVWRTPIFNTVNTSDSGLKNNLSIFPNPVGDRLFVKCKSIDKAEIIVHDMQGKIVYYQRNRALNNNESITINHLRTGTYVITVNANGQSVKQKLVKK